MAGGAAAAADREGPAPVQGTAKAEMEIQCMVGAVAEAPPQLEIASGSASPCSHRSSPSRSAATLMLHAAARAGELEQATLALNQGAAVDKQDAWGLTALHAASLAGHRDICSLLLERNAKVDAPSDRGQTALHLAATENHHEVVDVLMAAGADVAVTSAYGNTALELALRHGEGGLVELRIRAEFERRWRVAKTEVDEYRRRLRMAEEALATMEAQMGGAPEEEKESIASMEPGSSEADSQAGSGVEQEEEEEEEAAAAPAAAEATEAAQEPQAEAVVGTGEESPSNRRTSVQSEAATITLEPEAAASGPSEPTAMAAAPAPSQLDSVEAEKPKAQMRKMGYWRSSAATIEELRKGCEAVSSRAWVREPPTGDPFPHKGNFVASGRVLAEIDPDDPELVRGFERVEAAAEMGRLREERWATKKSKLQAAGVPVDEDDDDYDPTKAAREQEVLEKTMHPQAEWEQLVADLSRPEASWDWSKLEIHERKREEDRGKTPGVFAAGRVSRKNPSGAKPVFVAGDIVGPLGGMMRRRVTFEQVHYSGRIWVLHDPQAYEVGLRAKTTELSIEPLVLDMTSGESQNRLRHLADARNDPLGLRELLGANVRPTTAEAVLRPRTAMRRPRSRPRSPVGGEGAPQLPQDDDEANNITASDFNRSYATSGANSPVGRKAVTSSGVPPGENEDEAAQAAANVQMVEVYVNGWPYVFVVASRTIMPGEELLVDRGKEHWVISRFVLRRLRDVSQLGRDLLLGTKTEGDGKLVEDEPRVQFPPRTPTRRADTQAPVHRELAMRGRRNSHMRI